jgi:hypothetical protein
VTGYAGLGFWQTRVLAAVLTDSFAIGDAPAVKPRHEEASLKASTLSDVPSALLLLHANAQSCREDCVLDHKELELCARHLGRLQTVVASVHARCTSGCTAAGRLRHAAPAGVPRGHVTRRALLTGQGRDGGQLWRDSGIMRRTTPVL